MRLATHTGWIVLSLGLLGAVAVAGSRQQPGTGGSRDISDRLRALQREAAELNSREKSILAELRKLEIDRQIKSEELAALEVDVKTIEARLADTTARIERLRDDADATRPDVEERLVRLYKMGRAGYWRLLLDVDDARVLGRTYRMVSGLSRLDRESVQRHQRTLEALRAERTALESQLAEFTTFRRQAASARAALDRAVASNTALLRSIEARQDLAQQLAAELKTAQEKLDASVGTGRAVPAVLPLRPLKGEIPWPAEGIVIGRFGPNRKGTGVNAARNGIEISLAEGRPVAAVHHGVVTYAAPFTGYGQLVIVDHGNGAHSLYGHLASVGVHTGNRVQPGTRVGLSGRNPAGNPALYFELRIDGQPVDPLQWLRRP